MKKANKPQEPPQPKPPYFPAPEIGNREGSLEKIPPKGKKMRENNPKPPAPPEVPAPNITYEERSVKR